MPLIVVAWKLDSPTSGSTILSVPLALMSVPTTATSSCTLPVLSPVMTGASLALATVIVKFWFELSVPSLTVSTTLWPPTSALVGVPVRLAVPSPLSTKVSQPGSVGAVIVTASTSTSLVVIV